MILSSLKTKFLLRACILLSSLLGAQAFSQAAYPTQPIRLIVSFAAGGPTDVFARLVASKLEKELGQPIIVENKPGGGSNIGSEFVAKAKPDGYTLLVGTVANATNMGIYKNLGYDTVRDFAPITQIMSSPSVLVVNNNIPVKTLDELVAYIKERPGKLNYASSGAGGMQHHAAEMLKLRAGIDMLHIPYKGAAPALTDVIGGTVNMGFKTASGVMPAIQSGKVRAIAVAGNSRLAQLPDIPTMAEAGMPGIEADSWNGLFAPAGTPPAIINRLAEATIKVLQTQEIKERFAAISATPVGSSPEEFSKYVRDEVQKWGKVAKEANVQLN
ncbi:Bug family tripartite tricarboxylate transporter substrate binding protein [Zwartia vadi]|uniref:Bug family tripartite tricarboxylate transporter substrate binding protein n=1 Tax=Zwartia vadi TaxID=3058168 RepID=UPI0025B49982|nr:tripartite tricarboxylate transporter substrate binding protein [Zwartia vadi]MDN3986748.1 tripartite tricarboxylate transporter substrate binding protein [Zwartia vadi]